MDCEDGGWSGTEGNVGATFVDGNKNVEFHFCLVPLGYYNGGTLLVNLYGWSSYDGNVDIVDRYHDNEDHSNKNTKVVNTIYGITAKDFPGYCGFGENTTLVWMFSDRKSMTLPFQYGVLTNSFVEGEEDGVIHIDDENGSNSNWANVTRHNASTGQKEFRSLQSGERFRGVTTGKNTAYNVKINNN